MDGNDGWGAIPYEEDDGGALIPRNETPGDMWVGMPEGENCWEDEEIMEDGRARSEMAAAIRIRLPNAMISSSLSRLASSSSRTSPEISCSAIG